MSHDDAVTMAYCLFDSDLPTGSNVSRRVLSEVAVSTARRWQESVSAVAAKYGDDPDYAAARMRWALTATRPWFTSLSGATR